MGPKDYFHNNRLTCSISDERFVAYFTDLINVFNISKNFTEKGQLNKAKEYLVNEYGKFIPNIYDYQKEANMIFVGELSSQVIEIVLRYKKMFEELTDEDIQDLTDHPKFISENRIRLFILQEIRDITKILEHKKATNEL